MAWIFEPYNGARFTGRVAQMGTNEMKNLMDSVEGRIDSYIFGSPGELSLEGHYERLGGGDGWVFKRETGPASRMAMYDDGICAYIALVAEKPDSSFVYTLGRKSVWTPFDITSLYDILNKEEDDIITSTNKWAGSDLIGGSPRQTGSRIPPDKLQEIIKKAHPEQRK